ncbi:MAG: hypothetical protein JXQ73_33985 [Phycisphaerae bacterium]|nr:hypothetical protein [Phycisphaerae bacterium]
MRGRSRSKLGIVGCLLVATFGLLVGDGVGEARAGEATVLRAGAAAVDITPVKFPVIVNGGFLERTADKAHWPLHARCLALDDGRARVAIAVVDTCLMPRELLDEAKAIAHRATGIPTERMLISATHTHSAPSVMGALGTGVDEGYARTLPGKIAEAIERACKNLAPAEVGWAVVKDFEHTNCRRWIRRPDKVDVDPFGGRTVRAMMHPGYQNPDYLGPAGPVDADLSIVSVRSRQGRPIAVLANYSMHYFGAPAVSSDYYGLFADKLAGLIGGEKAEPPLVAMMSQGTAGDLHWMDYAKPKKSLTIDVYTEGVARVGYGAYKLITYRRDASIDMREKAMTLRRRVPDAGRLAWAKAILAKMAGRIPRDRVEVYAREQVMLAEEPTRELKLQAVRIGEVGIAAIPCEVYGITGLRLKARSPLRPTINVELANGCEGYIPPPEQHVLGGYTTWPARSAALEVEAELKIVDALLGLLEEVSGKSRRAIVEVDGTYAKAVLASRPLAYWRMGELSGSRVADSSGNGNHGTYEGGVALGLEGPESASFCGEGRINRAAHFAGGRMKAGVKGLSDAYTAEMWFCNYLPVDARSVTGYLFSLGRDGAEGARGDQLGIGGAGSATGKVFYRNGDVGGQSLSGKADVRPKTWHHLVMARDGKAVKVYLDGQVMPEVSGEADVVPGGGAAWVLLGGRSDGLAGFEGRIDEAAVYGRALLAEEIARHYAAVERRVAVKGAS